ncbi:hypothetical protein [Rheinheimera soli]|uniref:hypothetical protein n=1 Tax=Rheinheimera soli TaxID=443616 RepID=UPI001E49DE30|nr:hypothetical protein [Rheinheimera soli]
MSDNNLLKNIFLQAKRTSKILDVPLTKAKDLIARSIYECHDFRDLSSKLKNNGLKASVYQYCKLHPKSAESKSHVQNNIQLLAERFSRYLTAPLTQMPLLDLVWKIFGFQNQVSLEQILPSILLDDWKPYSPVSKDVDSVIYCDIRINNIAFKVLAAKIVTAYMFADSSLNELLALKHELSRYKFAPIMWSTRLSWENEIEAYFGAIRRRGTARDSFFDRLVLPKTIHQKVFQDTLYEAMIALSQEFAGTNIRYCNFGRETYFAVGFPIFAQTASKQCSDFYLSCGDIRNGKCLLCLGDNILALELFEVNADGDFIGDAEHYYQTLSFSLQLFEDATKEYVMIDGKHYEAYIRSCTDAEYALYKNPAIALADNFLEAQ